MTTRSKSWCALVALTLVPVFLGGCQQEVGDPTGVAVEAQENPNGKMPGFYEGKQVTINAFEVPGEPAILANNKNVNQIYAVADLDDPQMVDNVEIAPVIDAIPGEGFNPLWHQNIIHYKAGVTPFQLHSVDEINAAVTAGLITVDTTGDEIYRCAVVGPPIRP